VATAPTSAPGDLLADALAHEADDLAGCGVPSQRLLREDELTVQRDLEASVGGRDELNGLDDRCPPTQKFVRQTDGAWHVVSRNAEVDDEPVPGIEHQVALFVGGIAARLSLVARVVASLEWGRAALLGRITAWRSAVGRVFFDDVKLVTLA
jgi:hypothetical protein